MSLSSYKDNTMTEQLMASKRTNKKFLDIVMEVTVLQDAISYFPTIKSGNSFLEN